MIYLGLGSNQGDRLALLEQAIALIAKQIGPVVSRSSFMETEPWGFHSENLFLNAVIGVDSQIPPHELLKITQKIERRLGRTKKSSEGNYHDRPIDIDILLYDELIVHEKRLTIPHPLILERPFVFKPLLEIAPDVVHPEFGETISELISEKKNS